MVTDFKAGSRHRATQAEWDTIRDEKAGPCRVCGEHAVWAISYHHLVPRSLGGDDVEDNLIPLCGDGTTGCHGKLENHPRGWERIAHAVRHSLTPAELGYVLDTKGMEFLERYLPMGTPADDLCPRCRRPKNPAKLEKPRKRRTWSCKPPADTEDGCEILDTLVAECGRALGDLGYTDETPAYYVLTAVLSDWLKGGPR
jgi:hypothetical protein